MIYKMSLLSNIIFSILFFSIQFISLFFLFNTKSINWKNLSLKNKVLFIMILILFNFSFWLLLSGIYYSSIFTLYYLIITIVPFFTILLFFIYLNIKLLLSFFMKTSLSKILIKPKKKYIYLINLSVLSFLLTIFLVGFFYTRTDIEINHFEIHHPKYDKNAEEIIIAQISDLHIDNFFSLELLEDVKKNNQGK